MLLVCPKCVAQYEVDEQAIPESGREVQCANCEHIWFQDRLKMFSDKVTGGESPHADDEQSLIEDPQIFEDLDGVGDVEFRTARDGEENPDASESDEAKDDTENLLADKYDEDEYDDDAPMEIPDGGLPVNEDVLDVLRSEAAFSSARFSAEIEEETVNAKEEDTNVEIDELTAFLDAHSEDDTNVDEEIPLEESSEVEEPAPEPQDVFDPLADLDAIRSQLEEIGADEDDTEDPKYTAVLPVDDDDLNTETDADAELLEDDDIAAVMAALDNRDTEIDISDEGDSISYDDPVQEHNPVSADDYENDSDQPGLDNEPEVDEFEEYSTRRAFRADGAGADLDDDTESDDFDAPVPDSEESDEPEFFANLDPVAEEEDAPEQSGSAIPAAVALGALRPRSSNGAARVRSIRGAEDILEPKMDKPEVSPEAITQPLSRPTRPQSTGRSARPDTTAEIEKPVSRKELLPDVEELNATLRGEAAKAEKGEAASPEEDAPAAKTFGRSFAKAILFVAFLVALYVMRPMIVSAVPATAVVLDPYVTFIDSIRLGIEGLLG